MRNKFPAVWAGLAVLAVSSFDPAPDALADPSERDFHGADWQTLSAADQGLWQQGRWVRTWQGGHMAWWWAVAGFWYFYKQPAFPYPQSIPALAVTGAQPVALEQPEPQPWPERAWYFCPQPSGYPDVTTCKGSWHFVVTGPVALAQDTEDTN
jgi:hypothetical protein